MVRAHDAQAYALAGAPPPNAGGGKGDVSDGSKGSGERWSSANLKKHAPIEFPHGLWQWLASKGVVKTLLDMSGGGDVQLEGNRIRHIHADAARILRNITEDVGACLVLAKIAAVREEILSLVDLFVDAEIEHRDRTASGGGSGGGGGIGGGFSGKVDVTAVDHASWAVCNLLLRVPECRVPFLQADVLLSMEACCASPAASGTNVEACSKAVLAMFIEDEGIEKKRAHREREGLMRRRARARAKMEAKAKEAAARAKVRAAKEEAKQKALAEAKAKAQAELQRQREQEAVRNQQRLRARDIEEGKAWRAQRLYARQVREAASTAVCAVTEQSTQALHHAARHTSLMSAHTASAVRLKSLEESSVSTKADMAKDFVAQMRRKGDRQVAQTRRKLLGALGEVLPVPEPGKTAK